MNTTTTQPETLTVIRRYPNGKLDAVHAWETGHQVLVFVSQKHFESFKKTLDAKNESRKAAQ